MKLVCLRDFRWQFMHFNIKNYVAGKTYDDIIEREALEMIKHGYMEEIRENKIPEAKMQKEKVQNKMYKPETENKSAQNDSKVV